MGAAEPERVQEVEIVDRQVREIVNVLEAGRLAEAGVLRRDHPVALGQALQPALELRQAVGAVEIEERVPPAGLEDLRLEQAATDRHRAGLGHGFPLSLRLTEDGGRRTEDGGYTS